MNEKQLLIDLSSRLLPSEIKGIIERLELAAFKAGMTESIRQVAEVSYQFTEEEDVEVCKICKEAIQTARDQKTSL